MPHHTDDLVLGASRPVDDACPSRPSSADRSSLSRPLAPRAALSRVALLLPTLAGGGAERNTLRLAAGMLERGIAVDLLLCRVEGPLLCDVPDQVRIVPLHPAPAWQTRLLALRADPAGFPALLLPVLLARRASSAYRMLPALVRYLREHQPDALISNFPFENLLAIAARRLAATGTSLFVTEHNTVDQARRREAKWKRRFLPALLRRQYPMADAIVAVSEGIAEDLAQRIGLPCQRIRTIYNPILDAHLLARAHEQPEHVWFRPEGPPVVLGAGRLVPQKDFTTLIRAFARVRVQRPARLIILGQDRHGQRDALLALAHELGCAEDVSLPGYVLNPFAYMARASGFVLSSRHEGFANVVAEALACGCPVVSTNCPSGPAEILAGGRYGRLVPVGDDVAMADAILKAIDQPGDSLERRRQAALFSVDRALGDYLRLIATAKPERPVAASAALELAG